MKLSICIIVVFIAGATGVTGIAGATGATGAGAGRSDDSNFREMLSTMVHEANFLVENNLSFLVIITTVKHGYDEQLGTGHFCSGVHYNRVDLCTIKTNLPLKFVRYNQVSVNKRVRYNRVSLY